ncbi:MULTISPECIES: putative bifunctional diguanylate cyclase/phosphodiesterase [unclassified Halorhodospira]|uniref:putative bifunctional diguanylate cyclase/phosphodiesterase n=1 Tax=unclassified Halorhodospira TaxID=2626748 RepID=UPI001EE8A388|nr:MULTISPECIES: EAL domain-containing protein [unclassified Halorhodospira]MCG5541351.1 EAL domain-containing protein [Halorhodospira sp. M39old]MCG5546808.1 EAL domain-containing protein [Halorhodospira sp. M38]
MNTEARLLILDDDPVLSNLVVRELQALGYAVWHAADGQQGLESFEALDPDLVLVDIQMPVMDGFEFIRRVRGHPDCETVPLVMLTGFEDGASIDRAFELGASDFVTKPVNIPLLQRRIRFNLASARRELDLRRAQLEQSHAGRLARMGFWRMELRSGRLEWSAGAEETLGWIRPLPQSAEHLLTETQPPYQDRTRELFRQAVHEGEAFTTEVRLGGAQEERALRLSASPFADDGILVGAFQDITALRAFEDQALYLIEHDELTDLPNPRLFNRLLEERLRELQEGAESLTVLIIHVERLQRVKAGLGDSACEGIVIRLAQRLIHAAGPDAILGRLESDTFAVAKATKPDEESIGAYVQALAIALDHPYRVEGKDLNVNITIGFSVCPTDADEGAELVQNARRAQNQASLRHNEQIVRHRRIAGEDQPAHRIHLESELRQAIDNGEFKLLYQPQMATQSRRLEGVEALLRWNHPERGLLAPGAFLDVLEETGLVRQAGEWVLDEALRQLGEWHRQGYPLTLAVNISLTQIEGQDLQKHLRALTRQHGVPPTAVELEITEAVAMHDPERTIRILRALRAEGFRIALDDFGTGYAGMSYLLQLPLDALKIDRSFVQGIADGLDNRAIARAIAAMAATLSLTTIAEGVETEEQARQLEALHVDTLQGYLFARPLEIEGVTAILQQQGAGPD